MLFFQLERERALSCLDELETEYLRIGTERCRNLEERTQLSAFLRLGIRSVSLLRTMLRLLEPDTLDAYDAVRRAFYETWQLQFEFRLTDSAAKVQKWFQGNPDTWKADGQKLEAFIKSKAAGPGGLGREYGGLSELAHPTCAATANSTALVTTRRRMNTNPELLEQSLKELAGDFAELLNRQIWLTVDQNKELLDTCISPANLNSCLTLHGEYMKFLEQQERAAKA